MKRNRKVDLNLLDETQLLQVESLLSAKISDIVARAVSEANEFLNVYGIQARMAMELSPKDEGANLKTEGLEHPDGEANG